MAQDTIITSRQLREIIPVSEMTIWRWEKRGDFPKRIKIHSRNYWSRNEVSRWLESQKSADGEAESRKVEKHKAINTR